MNKHGVLLINLGSPDSPAVSDVRRYLKEFLMDGRVLDAPFPIRWAVVHGSILPTRSAASAKAYQSIWTDEGSPLVVTSRNLQAALQERLPLPVELAMRYQNPSVEQAVRRLIERDVAQLLVIALFPHYAMSSFESAVERVKTVAARIAPRMQLEVLDPFFDDPGYIASLVASAEPYLNQPHDHLLFSFHGLPVRHLKKSDQTGRHCQQVENCCEQPGPAHRTCYRAQCLKSVRAFVNATSISRYSIAFQSRLGREPWIEPYTDRELVRLAQQGVKRLLIMCPAFVSDCLETLEEIGIRGRETFREAGGDDLTLIPCLNTHPLWIATVEKWIRRWDHSPSAPLAPHTPAALSNPAPG